MVPHRPQCCYCFVLSALFLSVDRGTTMLSPRS
ncbi:hypothetical protein SETIT_2G105900v2 [Setaria italica]|uniref:Uncharacterized protein n=1 Tax=Setaria italica TaxID=4555 RepID=A0A368PXI9_SETIT|nr:hypothetical protein SETIT_2G105900v2 [Setaria italica]